MSELGPVGNKGPEGEQGPPGNWLVSAIDRADCQHLWQGTPRDTFEAQLEAKRLSSVPPLLEYRVTGELEKAEGKGITLQDIIGSKEVAATETGAAVLMPQEFDADNLQAYIQQEIEAGIKEHQTSLMRKVADVLADTITEERKAARDDARVTARAAAYEQSCRLGDFRAYIDAHRKEAQEFDKKRALDIAELETKVAKLAVRLEEKTQETKLLRSKLHAVSISKPVRKIKRRNHDRPSESTPKP